MFIFFDSETSSLGDMSLPYLYTYIVTDDRLCEVSRGYVRKPEEIVEVFKEWSRESKGFPVCYAYNLFFDLAPLMDFFDNEGYSFRFFAKTARDWVSVSLMKADHEVMRFVDLSFLQAGGIRLCGDIAGLPKMSGADYDYSLVRSPETSLSESELAYAYRDVEIMPRFLETLSGIYSVPVECFGRSILTVSQLSRFISDRFYGRTRRGRRYKTIKTLQTALVQRESPVGDDTMLLRRACFRGGYTFNSSKRVGHELSNVDVYDISSAYHFYIQSMRTPVEFQPCSKGKFRRLFEATTIVDPFDVFTSPNPFPYAFHVKLSFHNLRLQEPFKSMSTGCLSKSKFAISTEYDETMDATLRVQERNRSRCRDRVKGGVWFSEKLVCAERVDVHLSESELWIMSQVYDWDSFDFVEGEWTDKFDCPPDYQTGRSLLLYETKKVYKEVIVDGDLSNFDKLPASVQMFMEGEPKREALDVLYNGVKIQLNSLFGEMIRERLTPDWYYGTFGGTYRDIFTGDVPEWEGREYGFYTQGIRVSGYQRAALVALIVTADELGIECVYGDTDSLHVMDNEGFFASLVDARNECIEEINRRSVVAFQSRCGVLFDNSGVGVMVRENSFDRYCYGRMKTWCGVDKNGRFYIRQSGINTKKLARCVASNPEVFSLPVLVGWNVVYDMEVAKKTVRNCDGVGERTRVDFVDYQGKRFTGDVIKAVHLEDIELNAGMVETYRDDVEFLNGLGNTQDIRVKYIDVDDVYFFEYEME